MEDQAQTPRYGAWFWDAREGPEPVSMSLVLLFSRGLTFSGLGKDKYGLFSLERARLRRSLNPYNIGFTKCYQQHKVVYRGNMESYTTPLKASGLWYLADCPKIVGTWSMSLQGCPTLGGSRPAVSFIASSLDLGSSFHHLAQVRVYRALDRAWDRGPDPAWDLLLLLTDSDQEVARELARGQQVLSDWERERTWSSEEKRGSMDFQSPLCQDEFLEYSDIVQTESSAESSRKSVGREDKDMPPLECASGTPFQLAASRQPTLSADRVLHQAFNRVLGTRGGCWTALDLRGCVREYLREGDLASALRTQVMADFVVWLRVGEYREQLGDVMRRHALNRQSNGQPFLSEEKALSLEVWLDQEVTSLAEAMDGDGLSSYLDKALSELKRLMNASGYMESELED